MVGRPHPAVKICGVRTADGARAVAESGADFAGLLFVPGRRRAITVDEAEGLLPALGPVAPVGVVMNLGVSDGLALADRLGLRWLQLHGDEPPEHAERLARAGIRVIRALPVGDLGVDLDRAAAFRPYVHAFLLDGIRPGSGQLVSPDALPRPGALGRPTWLAGGLDPDNVAERLEATGLDGADVASGVEREGRPDPERIRRFVARAKRALRS